MIGLSPKELHDSLSISKSSSYALIDKYGSVEGQNSSKKIVAANIIRKTMLEKGFIIPKKNISFQVVKGGAGKTTLATNFSYRCAQYGIKVLLIDFDQQGNATRCFNVETKGRPVFLNLFRREKNIQDAIVDVNEYLKLLPSNLNNSRLDLEMSQSSSLNISGLINNILNPVRDKFDLIVMDCPPAINKINAAVTCASDLVIIPVNPDQYALDGMQFSISEIDTIKKEFSLNNLDFKLLWNKYDAREKLGAVYMHALVKDEKLLEKILPVVIRTDTEFKNAVHEKRPIFESPKKSSSKVDIDELCREILGIRDWVENHKGTRNEVA